LEGKVVCKSKYNCYIQRNKHIYEKCESKFFCVSYIWNASFCFHLVSHASSIYGIVFKVTVTRDTFSRRLKPLFFLKIWHKNKWLKMKAAANFLLKKPESLFHCCSCKKGGWNFTELMVEKSKSQWAITNASV